MARYVIISPNPEDDVMQCMAKWAKNSGLSDVVPNPRMIGWDFPFVSDEQKERFALRGYAAAYIIPDDFEPTCQGAELAYQETDNYAVITVTDPMSDPFEKIPGGYQKLIEYINTEGIEAKSYENRICFEEVYQKKGVEYMDIYAPVDK